MKLAFQLVLILGLLLSACSSPATPSPEPTAPAAAAPQGTIDLAGTKWVLTSYGKAGEEAVVIPGSQVTLELSADGQAGGTGGCNSFGGRFVVEDGRITFSDVVSTMMACEDPGVTQQESSYLGILGQVTQFQATAEQLTLTTEDGGLVLHFAPAS